MIMMTDNLAMKIISNLQIPLCRHYEIRKDSQKYGQRPSKIVKKSIFSKVKLTSVRNVLRFLQGFVLYFKI